MGAGVWRPKKDDVRNEAKALVGLTMAATGSGRGGGMKPDADHKLVSG